MFDWVAGTAIDAQVAINAVLAVVATVVALVLCHKGGWTLSRIIISVLSVALLLAAINNLGLFQKRVETDIKRGSAPVGVAYDPVDRNAV